MKGYRQFCPVAKGAEVFNERWTPLIIREMMCGSKRFNDLKRGNPMMSPSLLSQRLKFLEQAGVVEKKTSKGDTAEYFLTQSGKDLGDIVARLGLWGLKWARSRLTSDDYDPQLLMWDMRRRIDVSGFPDRRVVINFMFQDMPSNKRAYWLVVDRGEVDLCIKYPGLQIVQREYVVHDQRDDQALVISELLFHPVVIDSRIGVVWQKGVETRIEAKLQLARHRIHDAGSKEAGHQQGDEKNPDGTSDRELEHSSHSP